MPESRYHVFSGTMSIAVVVGMLNVMAFLMLFWSLQSITIQYNHSFQSSLQKRNLLPPSSLHLLQNRGCFGARFLVRRPAVIDLPSI